MKREELSKIREKNIPFRGRIYGNGEQLWIHYPNSGTLVFGNVAADKRTDVQLDMWAALGLEIKQMSDEERALIGREVSTWWGKISVQPNGKVDIVISSPLDSDALREVNEMEKWTDIIEVCSGGKHMGVFGLRADGTVVSSHAGQRYVNYKFAKQVSQWTDIVAIAASKEQVVGLKADGTVVAASWMGSQPYDVSAWTDVVAISSGDLFTSGIQKDGSVLVTKTYGYNLPNGYSIYLRTEMNMPKVVLPYEKIYRLPGINVFQIPEVVERKKEQLIRQRIGWEQEKDKLELELKETRKNLDAAKGIFAGKRRKKLEEQMVEQIAKIETLEKSIKDSVI